MCKADPKNRTILYFMCIPSKQKCDGIKQCPLGDDEEHCQLPVCKELQVRCREGTCATVCNGIPECDQLEDELFCGPVCKEGHLRCPDGNCAVVCDGKDDCKNKEDERNCKENLSSTDICKYGEVLCPDRRKCAKICDGIPQCEDGADEKFIC
ncbi:LDL receptor repeat-containing protein egg-2-like [Ruditapes philippinarum]|uniref:LDL receptor repeat-containing protein egg-2-like n=1 Tax=Ruditapes philippinarum TaxID=129788 RepID=UPI00295B05A6|nr:LDL receptor repeat-containing protein egg-2-like [Ruditapes philippinarum]